MAMGMAKPRVWPEDKAVREWLKKQKAKRRKKNKAD
ncbi:MAG: hypothetical protein JWR19_2188 [Pedosphaera sp.]|nr:hypothetical protein [Pedosphaera sp.]